MNRSERGTLKDLTLIQLHHIFKKLKQFSKKWVRKDELSKEWTSFIVIPNAQPEKK